MKCGVVVFPGSNCDHDVYHVLEARAGAGHHLPLAPGRPAQGLRPGGPARRLLLRRLPARRRHGGAVAGDGRGRAARRGRRAGARHLQRLPDPARGRACCPARCGATRTCASCAGTCTCRVERTDLPFTRHYREGQILRMPIAHAEGNYEDSDEALDALEAAGQVVFRYVTPTSAASSTPRGNPNGSARGDRRRRQRRRQRARHDAAPGALRRGDPRQHATAWRCSPSAGRGVGRDDGSGLGGSPMSTPPPRGPPSPPSTRRSRAQPG